MPKSADTGMPTGLELCEEAFARLRHAPVSVWLMYYLGSAPFVLIVLYAWADLANSAFAYTRLGRHTLLLTIGFLWMKAWQAAAFDRFLHGVHDVAPPRLTWARWWRMARQQAVIQSTGLFILPMSAFVLAPLPYAYAFYQSATAWGAMDRGAYTLGKRAWACTHPESRQNFIVMWLLSPLLLIGAVALILFVLPIMRMFSPEWTNGILLVNTVFWIVVILPACPLAMAAGVNIAVALILIPELLRRFLGIETVFSIGIGSMFTPTFAVTVCALTYLCLDPFCKAAYALRSFYLTSVSTGEDLLVALRRLRITAAAVLVAACILFGSAQAFAQSGGAVNPDRLDESIDSVFHDPAYAWRMPREQPEGGTILGDTVHGILMWVGDVIEWIVDKIVAFVDWLQGLFASNGGSGAGGVSARTLQVSVAVLVGVLLVLLGVMFWRTWRQRSKPLAEVTVTAAPAPDLEDETTTADALPEEGWLRLARELIEQRDYRLAMRAYFFAGLARLADRNIIRVAGYKANRDYGRELERVRHEEPGTVEGYWRGLRLFEEVWYGRHQATADLLERFRQVQREVGVREA